MEKEVLRAMEGVGGYYIFSLIMFFVFFLGVVFWAFKADKDYMEKMGSLPLDNNNANRL